LTARRLVAGIAEIAEDRQFQSTRRRGQWEREKAVEKWITLAGPAQLDRAILDFLTREVALRSIQSDADDQRIGEATVQSWQEALIELLSDELREGLPMHKLEPTTFREMTRQARNAEETLLAAVFACTSALAGLSGANKRIRSPDIAWPEPSSARDLLTRLDQDLGWNDVARSCLGWLKLSGANLFGANLVGANLIRADLHAANFDAANLFRADLREANLQATSFEGAIFVGVRNLDEARQLDEVRSWHGARIERKWVERLGLDAEKLGLIVVADLDDPADDEGGGN
jgi:hypothetical protein